MKYIIGWLMSRRRVEFLNNENQSIAVGFGPRGECSVMFEAGVTNQEILQEIKRSFGAISPKLTKSQLKNLKRFDKLSAETKVFVSLPGSTIELARPFAEPGIVFQVDYNQRENELTLFPLEDY